MWIERTGLACPVGLGARNACVAMRAGLSALAELPYRDDDGAPLVGASVERFPPHVGRADRLVELLLAAVEDCLHEGYAARGPAPVAILVAWPGPEQMLPPALEDRLVAVAVAATAQGPPVGTVTAALSGGPTAGLRILRRARELLRREPGRTVLACAVDSLVRAAPLADLARAGRLRTSANSDGLLPGEGAACLLLTGRRPAHADAVAVDGLGFGVERATVINDEPLQGLGLLSAVRDALVEGGASLDDVGMRISDVSGESYAFHEQSLVAARLLRRRKDTLPLWHPAEYTGYLGTAAGLGAVVVAEEALRNDHPLAATALCTAGDESGERAAVLLRRGPA